MVLVEKLQPGVNGVILPVTVHGRPGYVFEAPDKTRGPFHPEVGKSGATRAFYQARLDWRSWLDKREPAIAPQ